jgi:hypothetical protein
MWVDNNTAKKIAGQEENFSLQSRVEFSMKWPADKIERRPIAQLIPYAAECAHIS